MGGADEDVLERIEAALDLLAKEKAQRRAAGGIELLQLLDKAANLGATPPRDGEQDILVEVPEAVLALSCSNQLLAAAGAKVSTNTSYSGKGGTSAAFRRASLVRLDLSRDLLRSRLNADDEVAAFQPVTPASGVIQKNSTAPEMTGCSDEDLAWAMQDSLKMAEDQLLQDDQPGAPLLIADLKALQLYFESQPQGSDTCGVSALNNLCQRKKFNVDALTKAELELRKEEAGSFVAAAPNKESSTNAPRGFFEVEALKRAATKLDLEVVEVEPVKDYRGSAFKEFADTAGESRDSWFLGFLVYDRRPNRPMHYYVLRRDERHGSDRWVKMDSLQRTDNGPGSHCLNRILTGAELWQFYEENATHFASWLLRWYPVVYRPGGIRTLQERMQMHGFKLPSEMRAKKTLQQSSWLVSRALDGLLRVAPMHLERELLIHRLSVMEVDARKALDAANGDAGAAATALGEALMVRAQAGSGMEITKLQEALGICDWDVDRTTKVIALQGRLGETCPSVLPTLLKAVELAGNDLMTAEALALLAKDMGDVEVARDFLERLGLGTSVERARRVLKVRQRFQTVPLEIAVEALRRGDEDPHAAGELLAELCHRVEEIVKQANASIRDLRNGVSQHEVAAVSTHALNASDWEPSKAFTMAQQLPNAVASVRRSLSARHQQQYSQPSSPAVAASVTSLDQVLIALTSCDMDPNAATSMVLNGGRASVRGGSGGYAGTGARKPPARAKPPEDDDSSCGFM